MNTKGQGTGERGIIFGKLDNKNAIKPKKP
jgi:hypothetical protein